ncbi:MAG TPA: Rieske (2Fe-2S) protein, partial [Candidatus Latescibacteria bacterium]|nr:Rieske (2Fe-2S) protein [Candidatus Latescibacterota bacterium]
MSKQNGSWTRAGSMGDLEPGDAKAVQLGDEGRSVALFNVEGKIYATDNQCPHMGYPLTRGVVRNGILTCDWHGRRFDLDGGGCFNNLCDDLEVFPVDVREGEIWIQQADPEYRRKEEHLSLLWEGLLRADRWT